MKVGETVYYQGSKVDIEELNDEMATITNPLWNFDEEGLASENDEIYDEPYWIKVPVSELSHTW